MSTRALPRAQLTHQEIEAGGSYYSEGDIDRIIDSIPDASEIDRERLKTELHWAADWYLSTAHGTLQFDEAPSVRAKRWAALGSALKRAEYKLRALPPQAVSELNYAAERVAERKGKLPDFEPDILSARTFSEASGWYSEKVTTYAFAAGKQISKAQEAIQWLQIVVAEAEAGAIADKSVSGSKPPDEPKLSFCRYLDRILKEIFGQQEVRADIPKSGEHATGPLADFLEACFAPLGIRDSRTALVLTFHRARGFTFRKRPR